MDMEPAESAGTGGGRPFEDLVVRYLDGDLSPDGMAELNAALTANPESRQIFNELCLHSLAISEHFAAEGICTPVQPPAHWLSRRRVLVGSATAAGILVAGGLKALKSWWSSPEPGNFAELAVARLEDAAGLVTVGETGREGRPIAVNQSVEAGQTISTVGESSSARIRCADGTALVLAGNTSIALPEKGTEGIRLQQGDLAANVKRSLRIVTPEREVQVLGAKLTLASSARQTLISVPEPAGTGQSAVQVKRFSDGMSVPVRPGQRAVAFVDGDLRTEALLSPPDQWQVRFGPTPPSGWEAGDLVFDDLPEGSQAAMRAVPYRHPKGGVWYKLTSNKDWTNGLFAIHDDSWLHVRFRIDKPGFFHTLVVARDRDAARRTCVVLEDNRSWAKRDPRRWYTIHVPFAEFRPTVPGVQIEKPLVAFLVSLDCQQVDRGLTIDRLWVTRGPETT